MQPLHQQTLSALPSEAGLVSSIQKPSDFDTGAQDPKQVDITVLFPGDLPRPSCFSTDVTPDKRLDRAKVRPVSLQGDVSLLMLLQGPWILAGLLLAPERGRHGGTVSPPTSSPGRPLGCRLRPGVTLTSQHPGGCCSLRKRLHLSISFSPSVGQNGDLGPRRPRARRVLQPPLH